MVVQVTGQASDLLPFYYVREELSVFDNLLLRNHKVVIPEALTPVLVHNAHEAHPGIVRTKQRLRDRFRWFSINCQVELEERNCHTCHAAEKSAKPAPAPLQPVALLDRLWQKLAMNIP